MVSIVALLSVPLGASPLTAHPLVLHPTVSSTAGGPSEVDARQLAAASASLALHRPVASPGASLPPRPGINSSVLPPARTLASMAFDAADGYVVLFGGQAYNSGNQVQLLNDTWTFSNGSWTERFPSVAPPPTYMGAMAYDANRSVVVLFGGDACPTGGPSCGTSGSDVYVNTTWTFHAGAWTQLPLTHAPSDRASPALTYDPKFGGLVLFGGMTGSPAGNFTRHATTSDTWTFVNGTWTNVTGSVGVAPAPRWWAGFTYDPSSFGAVLFGGAPSGSTVAPLRNDTWLLGNSTWRNVTPAVSPPPSSAPSLTYVFEGGTVVLFGGENDSYTQPWGETWSFSAGVWTHRSTTVSPPAVWGAAFTDDLADHFGLMFGGNAYSPGVGTYGGITNDSWTYAYGNWSRLGTNASLPPAGASVMVYDTTDHEVVLFSSGYAGSTSGLGSTWAYRAGSWGPVPSVLEPPARQRTSMAYDAADGYVVLFGGLGDRAPLNDTWTFRGGNWTLITPSVSPPATWVFPVGGLAYDARDGVVVLFDGQTWTFHAGAWTLLHPALSPNPAGYGDLHAAYDAKDSYVVLTFAFNRSTLTTWTFAGGNWTDRTNASAPIPPRTSEFSFAYDPMDREVVLFGGWCLGDPRCGGSGATSNQTWAYSASGWTNETSTVAPSPRFEAAATDDPGDGYLLLFGGVGMYTGGGSSIPQFADTWNFSAQAWHQIDPSFNASLAAVDLGVATTLTAHSSAPSGSATYTYSGLPRGCVSANTPALACTPAQNGTFTVVVTIGRSGFAPANASTQIVVHLLPTVASFGATRTKFAVGNLTTLTVAVQGGTPAFTYGYAGLPADCPSANAPVVNCTTRDPGTYTVTVTASDRFGKTTSASLELNVTPATAPGGGGGPCCPRSHPPVSAPLVTLFGLTLPTFSALVAALVVASALVAREMWRIRLRREGERLVRSMRDLDETEETDLPR